MLKALKGETDLTLRCIICTRPIDENRARRNTATCSEPCKDRLDFIRAKQRESRRCPHCLNPSTPEERQEFREWRAQRKANDGYRPTLRSPAKLTVEEIGPNKRKIVPLLRRAIRLLDVERKVMIESYTPPDNRDVAQITERSVYETVIEMGEVITKAHELLDKKREPQRTLDANLSS